MSTGPTMEQSLERRALEWAIGDDVGSSSRAIARHMTGLPGGRFGYEYPSDGGDLGRCIALLDAVPEWRQRLPEMAQHSPQWAALVEHWDELAGLFATARVEVYDRMKRILAAPEKADKNLIVLGNGASIRFGA